MDARFENRYVETEQIVLEYYVKVKFRRLILQNMFLLCVSMPALAYFSMIGDTDKAIVAAVLSVIWLGSAIAVPWVTHHQAKKRRRAFFGEERGETVTQFVDSIVLSGAASSMTLEYSQIVGMIRLKHSIALRFGENLSILLAPDGFTVGNPDDFEAFLRARCPNLMPRRFYGRSV
jgi:hypothetical protein